MTTLAPGLSFVDLDFLRVPRVIATAVLQGANGAALVDPGPSSALPVLARRLQKAGIGFGDVSALLLTHIHLDHAGAAGTIVARHPHIKVYVHEKGAPHLAHPDKLLSSATRLYGDAMDRLWGEVRPVPQEAMTALAGGETLEVAGHALEVAYTPGHASHHVSYFDPQSAVAFVGDTAGVQVTEHGYVLPPTPPPDIDLELWRASLSRIAGWRPQILFMTHFGPAFDAAEHLRAVEANLALVGSLAQASLARDDSDVEREGWFCREIRRELRRNMPEADVRAYEVAGRFDLSWRGLARYYRKKAESKS